MVSYCREYKYLTTYIRVVHDMLQLEIDEHMGVHPSSHQNIVHQLLLVRP